MFLTHLQTAGKQLLANKGKALLTMLGIMIGIGSVIMIMTLGEIAKRFLLSQLTQFGTNVVEVGVTGDLGPFQNEADIYFTQSDIRALRQSNLLTDMAGISSSYTLGATLEYNGDPYEVSVWGDTAYVFTVNNLPLLAGRLFDESDERSEERVIVLSKQSAENIFNTVAAAVGKPVRLDGTVFTVIGVVGDLPLAGGPLGGNFIYVPLASVYAYLAPADDRDRITFILVEFAEGVDAKNFQDRLVYEIKRIKQLNQNDDDKLMVMNREQFLEIFNTILLAIQLFVAAIAAISLLVGGIGIMNIMLVTVKERTKEIGLRKAIGATNRSILTQFLIEAAMLTTVGGLLGISLGLIGCWIIVFIAKLVQPDWQIEFVIVPTAIILASAVSMTTGIIFGLYPAMKAARLQPIEALRYE